MREPLNEWSNCVNLSQISRLCDHQLIRYKQKNDSVFILSCFYLVSRLTGSAACLCLDAGVSRAFSSRTCFKLYNSLSLYFLEAQEPDIKLHFALSYLLYWYWIFIIDIESLLSHKINNHISYVTTLKEGIYINYRENQDKNYKTRLCLKIKRLTNVFLNLSVFITVEPISAYYGGV